MIALYKEVKRMITEQKIDRSVGTPLTIKPSFSAGEMNVLHFHNFQCLMLYDKAAKIRKNPRTFQPNTIEKFGIKIFYETGMSRMFLLGSAEITSLAFPTESFPRKTTRYCSFRQRN
jgi:hypothetical protein